MTIAQWAPDSGDTLGMTGSTAARAGRPDVRVLASKRVPVLAVRPDGVPGGRGAPAQDVVSVRDGFQMGRVHAATVAAGCAAGARLIAVVAQMVKIVACGDRSDEPLVVVAVGGNDLHPVPHAAVARPRQGSLPFPAPGHGIDDVLVRGFPPLVAANEPLRLPIDRSDSRIGRLSRPRWLTTSALTQAARDGRMLMHRKASSFWCHAPGRSPRRRGFAFLHCSTQPAPAAGCIVERMQL